MATTTMGGGGRFWEGVWRVADPKITLASVAGMALGAGAAAGEGPLHLGWLAVTAFGIFCVEAAKNASGEVIDWDSGADRGVAEEDRSPFSGGKRVLVDGLLSRGQTWAVAAVFYAGAIATGLAIVGLREPRVLALGMIGMALAFFYHAPPVRLAYRGLGELAVAVAYGPILAAGTYLVQRQGLAGDVLLASLPLGAMIAAFLWINEFPDRKADAAAHKRTWVVRLGAPRAARAFAGLVATAYLAVLALPLFDVGVGAWLGLLGLPHGVAAARRLLEDPCTTAYLVPAQGWTLLSFLLLAGGLAAGLAST